MRYKELTELNIDNEKGWGQVPLNQEVDYFGLRVKMRPSVFLKLARPLEGEPRDTIRQHIKKGGAVGAPFLYIRYPDEWENGDFTKYANVTGHEGRNRMTLTLELEGDEPVETHIFFRNPETRRRHITDAMIAEMNKRLSPEGIESMPYKGPFFTM